jgi:integrase
MASLTQDGASGRWTVQFVGRDGKRRSVRLGPQPKRQAENFRVKIEELAGAVLNDRDPSDETSRWVAEVGEPLRGRLAAVGLIHTPAGSLTLKAFIDDYLASRSDLKAGTKQHIGHTAKNLIDFFGAEKPLRSLTEGDGDEWRRFLGEQKLAEPTIRRRCGIGKQLLRAAQRKHLIPANPFADLRGGNLANPDRAFNVTGDMAAKILDACTGEWKLIFALLRFGGLRCPSELMGLRWNDVLWGQDRIIVHSPKTAHHPGHESRVTPLFPELMEPLREAFEAAAPGTEYIVNRHRGAAVAPRLRQEFLCIIAKAGLQPWPRLFRNLRSSRQTELVQQGHPLFVACAWLGNSQPVAARHYLQVTDADYSKAVHGAVQKAVQPPCAEVCLSVPLSGGQDAETPFGTPRQGVAQADTHLTSYLSGING